MKIAVVDDCRQDAQTLSAYLKRWQDENPGLMPNGSFLIECFFDGFSFLEACDHKAFDIVFMDIEMPSMNGLETAKSFREKDSQASIVFVTNMGQYAIKGYEVRAIDFVLKPVTYFDFAYRFQKALDTLSLNSENTLLLETNDGAVRITYDDIYYVDKQANSLMFHGRNKTLCRRGNLQDFEEDFISHGFAKCNRGCLVNLRRIERVRNNDIYINGEVIPISRGHEKSFHQALIRKYGR